MYLDQHYRVLHTLGIDVSGHVGTGKFLNNGSNRRLIHTRQTHQIVTTKVRIAEQAVLDHLLVHLMETSPVGVLLLVFQTVFIEFSEIFDHFIHIFRILCVEQMLPVGLEECGVTVVHDRQDVLLGELVSLAYPSTIDDIEYSSNDEQDDAGIGIELQPLMLQQLVLQINGFSHRLLQLARVETVDLLTHSGSLGIVMGG